MPSHGPDKFTSQPLSKLFAYQHTHIGRIPQQNGTEPLSWALILLMSLA